ncbi:putative microtubule-severing ATPase [Helianthus annuus]|nr:putative microtubule-severing ATPase [Helianthus annuus]
MHVRLSMSHAGATNRPQELDDVVLRRLVKRIYMEFSETVSYNGWLL